MAAGSAIVNGNPALCAWLVIAIAITVSDFLLNRSWLRIKDRPQSGLLAASDRVQVCSVHFASQYSGQAWSPTTLFGQQHFLSWVDFSQFAREPGPFLTLAQ